MKSRQAEEEQGEWLALRFAIFVLIAVLVESVAVAGTLIYLYQHPVDVMPVCEIICL